MVAPLVGAWIEIEMAVRQTRTERVAPLVGAWIEISLPLADMLKYLSLPLWERGLKCLCHP